MNIPALLFICNHLRFLLSLAVSYLVVERSE